LLWLFTCLIVINCHPSVYSTNKIYSWQLLNLTLRLQSVRFARIESCTFVQSHFIIWIKNFSSSVWRLYRHQNNLLYTLYYYFSCRSIPCSMRNNWVNFPTGKVEAVWREEKFDIKNRYNMVCMGVTWGDDDNEWAKKRKIRNSDLWYEKYIYHVCMRGVCICTRVAWVCSRKRRKRIWSSVGEKGSREWERRAVCV